MCMYSISDFGATGNGIFKNTAAIQAAIDKCYENGGGQVIIPPGEFISGTIYFKNNVDLHLMPGAVLKASPDIEDYNADDCFTQNRASARENATGAHLIIAYEVENVSISGNGKIDGNGASFFADPLEGRSVFSIKDKRPGQMLFFCECINVHVENIELNNSPYWTLFLHGCSNATVRGVKISNPRQTPNGDGIDIDCCRNVTVSDCIIFSGDDCITLRGNNAPLKDKSKICENVAVSNCILSTTCNAIRVGVGDGLIRDCTFSNILVKNTRNGICLISKYSAAQQTGATIKNIMFSNFVMETVMPFYLASGLDAVSRIENIYFSNIVSTASKTSFLYGSKNTRPRNINFTNIELAISAGREYMSNDEIDISRHRAGGKGINSVFFCSEVDAVNFKNLKIKWKKTNAPWQHCFKIKSADIRFSGEEFSSPPETECFKALEYL